MKSTLKWSVAILALFFAVIVFVPSASTQPPGPRLADELNRTDAIIRDARARVGDMRPARELLRNAMDHQNRARALFNARRPGPAAQETMLARRLAERAMNPAGGGEPQDIERALRRMDRRVQLAEEWLRDHGNRDEGLREDLATAERQLARAWQAYRAGQNAEALKHAATVRQILGDFPAASELEPSRDRVDRQLDATDRMIDVMHRSLREPYASRLDAAREAQRRARERLNQGRPVVAIGLGLEARAHAIRVWVESGSGADKGVTAALVEANRLTIEDLEFISTERPGPKPELADALATHAAAVRSLNDGSLVEAWRLALETARYLWTARQNANPENRPGFRR